MKLPINYETAHWSVRKKAREAYIVQQQNKCYWCKQPLDQDAPKWIKEKPIVWEMFPPNFLKHPIHLQHCHETGMSEGAVHAYCNAVMFQYHGR